MDEPYCTGYLVAGCDVGLDPHGHAKGMTGSVGYWHVEDIESTLRNLTVAGAAIHQDVTVVGGGKRIASVRDAAGNVIGLLQNP